MAAELTCPAGHKMPPPDKRGRNVYVMCVQCGKRYRARFVGPNGVRYVAKSGRGLVRVSIHLEAEQAAWVSEHGHEAARSALQRGIDTLCNKI